MSSVINKSSSHSPKKCTAINTQPSPSRSFGTKKFKKKRLKEKEKDLKRKGEKGITHMQKMRNVVVFCDLSK